MNLYDKEIVKAYGFLKRKAIKECARGNAELAIGYVEKLSTVANQLNWMFHDEQLSCLMDDLSAQLLTKNTQQYNPHKMRVVFYDQYGKSFILAQQYIGALIKAGYEILYILSDYVDANRSTFIIEDLQKCPSVHVEVVPKQFTYQERAKLIRQLTLDFAPSKVFLHVKMFSVFNLVLPSLPELIDTYYIDLQDHAMWIKNHQLKYVMPYRDWGATIDVEKRGFSKDQVLLMPYYPIVEGKPFQGFPDGLEGKVVIFTGGELYKTMDWDNSYWNIVVRILAENPNVVVLYAAKGDVTRLQRKAISNQAALLNVEERLLPIGFRTDINEVFRHCDIYLGTSPMSGGLMCQYAAVNAKPILQYYRPDMAANNETEQVLNYNDSINISFTDVPALLQEAKHLINDADYRKTVGERLRKSIIRKEQFDDLLEQSISKNARCVEVNWQKIGYDRFVDWWFYLERYGISNCRQYLLSLLKKKRFFVMPLSSIRMMVHRMRKQKRASR